MQHVATGKRGTTGKSARRSDNMASEKMNNDIKTVSVESRTEVDDTLNFAYSEDGKRIDILKSFASIGNKMTTRNLNNEINKPTFSRYTKDNITLYLTNPYTYESQLRSAVVYIYGASSHFRRLIQYFASLTDLSYVISPYKVDPTKANRQSMNRNYRRVLNMISSINPRTTFANIVTVCLREDVFYATMWVFDDSITIQQLPSDYCKISTVEGNVPNVTFDFSYFDSRSELLPYYPKEFEEKYNVYKKNRTEKWIELDSPTSFAVKCNRDILDYSIPPFAGVLREIYDIEDYKQLKLTKTSLENYAMLVMTLGINPDGTWQMNLEKAKEFWMNLDSVLPEEIGSILSPMPIDKISFEKTNTASVNTVAEAEQNLFSAAGVSSLLFNNEKASANALSLSIKADQAITFGIVKGIEDALNRFLQTQSYGKNFKITFLDVSPFNRKEVGDMYLKAAQYGLPTVSMYCASQGLAQTELDSMNFLENDVLMIKELFKPLASSSTMSSSSNGATDEGGAPQKDASELTESGIQNREDA